MFPEVEEQVFETDLLLFWSLCWHKTYSRYRFMCMFAFAVDPNAKLVEYTLILLSKNNRLNFVSF